MGFLGNWGSQGGFAGGCGISGAGGGACHLCGGLPGGGTAETDARQGKSVDKKPGRPSGGRRVRLGSRPGCAARSPCCSQLCNPLQLASRRDKREGKKDAKAQEESEGEFFQPSILHGARSGFGGGQAKKWGSSRIRAAIPSAADAERTHSPRGKRARALSNGPASRTPLALELITQRGRRAMYFDT